MPVVPDLFSILPPAFAAMIRLSHSPVLTLPKLNAVVRRIKGKLKRTIDFNFIRINLNIVLLYKIYVLVPFLKIHFNKNVILSHSSCVAMDNSTEVCCGGEKATGDGCCGATAYTATTDLCCLEDNASPKITTLGGVAAATAECCCTADNATCVAMDNATEVCCSGTKGTGNDCCGATAYSTTTDLCCLDGSPDAKTSTLGSVPAATAECCCTTDKSSCATMDNTTDVCCSGTIGTGDDCCGATAYLKAV